MLEWVAFPFFRGIFPNQGSNSGLLPCRQILYQLSHRGSPRILEWVAHPFPSWSSRPRNWTQVSTIFSLLLGGRDSFLRECPACVFTFPRLQSLDSWPKSIILQAPQGKTLNVGLVSGAHSAVTKEPNCPGRPGAGAPGPVRGAD